MYFFYYVPVGVDVSTKRFPVMTVFFALVCTVIFALVRYFPDTTAFDPYGLIFYPGYSGWFTAVGAAFLHFGWVHLIGNLVYLLLFGGYLEDRLGIFLYTALFVGSAVVGNVAQGFYNTNALHIDTGIIGASGAVSGILGAFLVRLYGTRVRIAYWVFLPLHGYTRAGRVYLPVVFAVAIWVLLQVSRGLIQLEGASASVAYMTHIAGFAFGVVFTSLTGGWKRGREEAHLIRASRYVREGEYFGARDEFSSYLHYQPEDGEVHAQLARVQVQSDDELGARASYLMACELLLRCGQRGRAEAVYREAVRGFANFTLSPDPHLDMSFGLERNLKLEVAISAYENFVRQNPTHSEAPFALLRAANLHIKLYGASDKALACYRQLISQYPEDAWVDYAREQVRVHG
ncbi:MAG: rhomboid family intramembrane serine protease [Candidatus Krumholzibacteriota bacterium]|nr:rhomboid family intramembrane serine protease [Candidatus Krumholzibacteriota bacterium]